MEIVHLISIFIEAAIAILGLAIGLENKKSYGFLISLTFGIYVFYDLAKSFPLNISEDILYFLFFVASISMLLAVWQIYYKKK